MEFWYIVEERAKYAGKIGDPISAEIVDVKPRKGGKCEWHDTENVGNGVYVREKWLKSKREAEEEIKFWMS